MAKSGFALEICEFAISSLDCKMMTKKRLKPYIHQISKNLPIETYYIFPRTFRGFPPENTTDLPLEFSHKNRPEELAEIKRQLVRAQEELTGEQVRWE